jgi:hypothetical protein
MPEKTSLHSSDTQPSKWGKNKLGAFWIKKKDNGSSYLSGVIEINGEKVPCVIFKNDYQEGNTPHFNIYTISQS